ncbi:ATP-dependent helicase [Cohnella lupini]|uniref:DNA 3'-5' helicase n=1 Tax=Cohnella lupini TaxID=1294267 RepID=A0A3D9IV86_9BACL|nr:ATP-dependent helicase [Cohnella lupini]RED65585.1 DNA helicase-2/ATP-dependent DNA helicase PcrA [Cohnella lupini]
MTSQTDFFTRKKTEINVALNEVQQQAAMTTEGALLLLASPGSGKTTTLIMRIGYLIEAMGVRSSRIKAVTFSRASALDMKERFNRFFPSLSHEKPDFSTIHSLAFEVVREHFQSRNLSYRMIESNSEADNDGSYSSEPPINKTRILRDIYKRINGDNVTDDQMEELTGYISFIKNKLIPMDRLSEAKCDVPKAESIFKEYESFKQSGTPRLLVDFDDMLTIANEALAEDPVLLGKYQKRYDYVMTDESQDTSLVQHAIIEKLVRKHGNLCVVADDDQSIYAWRAAEPQYLLDFKQVYPNAAILKMEQNYRSSPNIVDAANRFIKRNRNRYDKNMFTLNPKHSPVAITELPDYRVQANYVVEKIKDAADYNEVAVLYRNNSSSIMLMNALERAGIPFYMKDGDNRFFSHWVVEDMLNFMRLTFNDKRPDILEKIHTKFNGYITKQQMAALTELSAGESVFDTLLQKVALQEYQIKQLQNAQETIVLMQGARPLQAIRTIRDKLGYDKAIEKMCERLGFRKDYLVGILNTLEEIAEPLDTMEDFAKRLKFLEKNMKESKFNKNGSAITLSTLHSSKGLEFSSVYMIDLVEGVIPSNDDNKKLENDQPGDMEEAVRLFYVGMTRAKQRLELLSYKKKDGEPVQTSRFVTAIRDIQDPPKAEKIPIKPPEGKKTRRDAKPSVPYNPNAIKDIDKLEAGKRVQHRVFGGGEIVLLDGDSVEIRFPSETKRLSVNICLEMGLLEPL